MKRETETCAAELFAAIADAGALPVSIRVKTKDDREGLATFALKVPADHKFAHHPNPRVRALHAVRIVKGLYIKAKQDGYEANYYA